MKISISVNFLRLTQFYRLLEFPVPQVYCIDDAAFQVLIEDLGNVTLCDIFHKDPVKVQEYYASTIRLLLDLQSRIFRRHTESPDISSSFFGHDDLLWESGYFREYFLESYRNQTLPSGLSSQFEKEFNLLADSVARHPRTIMHRDFQSQNIMIQKNTVRIIDYQGSRLGSQYYDLASLLLDPYTNMPQDTIEKYFTDYHTRSGTAMSFDESYSCFLNAGTQRLLQALGAYCNLSFHKNMNQFEQYIEPAIEKLCWVMKNAGLKNLYNILKPFL